MVLEIEETCTSCVWYWVVLVPVRDQLLEDGALRRRRRRESKLALGTVGLALVTSSFDPLFLDEGSSRKTRRISVCDAVTLASFGFIDGVAVHPVAITTILSTLASTDV
ncbi:hypothetical protein PHSY_001235 [Pseudozyma hubeiensis SY62]|uniref:Uncharacterized protein n=1 Tax=Pseudozyma hubeiensis (strain SY62) TaxID=1305764 RepID=R9P6D5_PSEHS|nr:hypothetical protein PHSY_001235 [Pseudozyma hubeiensis SY62]GAC93670.1 hypothetical protein PHSY_001235 [Pseudozyma hubeiensis SY62]